MEYQGDGQDFCGGKAQLNFPMKVDFSSEKWLNSLMFRSDCVDLKMIKPAKAIRANASSNWRVPHF